LLLELHFLAVCARAFSFFVFSQAGEDSSPMLVLVDSEKNLMSVAFSGLSLRLLG